MVRFSGRKLKRTTSSHEIGPFSSLSNITAVEPNCFHWAGYTYTKNANNILPTAKYVTIAFISHFRPNIKYFTIANAFLMLIKENFIYIKRTFKQSISDQS